MNRRKKVIISSIQNLSEPLATLLVPLIVMNPNWVGIVGLGAGLIAVWRDLAEDRGTEILKFINDNVDKFSKDNIQSNEFRSTFLNVWEMCIRENSENKRRRLHRFLIGIGQKNDINSDLHTKIYSVINQLTDSEAEIFGFIYKEIQRKPDHHNLHVLGEHHIEHNYHPSIMEDACNSLHAYRLVDVVRPQIGSGLIVMNLTTFGEIFYGYIIKFE